MSAELLREAASLMRARAEAASAGPWRYRDVRHQRGGQVRLFCAGVPAWIGNVLASGDRPVEDAEHIAGMDPTVALALADWLDSIARRHAKDPDPVELALHFDQECPTGECVEPGYHEGCIVCTGCYPTWDDMVGHSPWDDMVGHSLWPCVEFKAALAVATAYLGSS